MERLQVWYYSYQYTKYYRKYLKIVNSRQDKDSYSSLILKRKIRYYKNKLDLYGVHKMPWIL